MSRQWPANRLERWLDRRMYLQLAREYQDKATQCRRNAITNACRSPFWDSEALYYLDVANGYIDKRRQV